MAADRVKIRETLISLGVPEEHVAQKIRSEVFPWYARMLDNIRLLLGGNPYTAEHSFVEDIANCSSGDEIEEAFFDYRMNSDRRNRVASKILGLAPRLRRVRKFYKKLRSQGKQMGL